MRTAMESATRNTIKLFWEVIAFLANSIAFLFIGFQTDLFTLSQSIVLIIAAFVAVTIARAATVFPIFAFFSRRGEKLPRIWGNVALLGGVRGALSIVLAATITVSAVITLTDITIIRTMALGVAFLSITFQVPILFRYVKAKFKNQESEQAEKDRKELVEVGAEIEETYSLRNERQISDREFVEKLEACKGMLDDAIHESSAMLETKQIIQERANMLYSSGRRKRKPKKPAAQKKKPKEKPEESGDAAK
jgi:NhaP-type Na+/H+ or K+/H+ antiporter